MKLKLSKLRIISLIAGVGLIIGFTSAGKGIGTFCNLCPVGFLQITAAARAIPTGMILGVSAGVLLVIVLGRFFCAWLCPSALVKSSRGKVVHNNKTDMYSKKPAVLRYMPYIVLGLALIVSFAVRFPVFCLICPIGLFFGFIYAVFGLFHTFEPEWNLIIFPAIIALELLIFRRWCSYICPVSGVFTLLAKLPLPKLRLRVNSQTCLLSRGVACHACERGCPEEVSVVEPDKAFNDRCSNCMTCRDKCPTKSIKY